MIITGKYNEAEIFTNIVDDASIEQVRTLCDQKFSEGAKIRLMPDIHAGAGCTIGTTMTIKDKIVPNLVGVDIGCGMLTTELGKIDIDFKQLDRHIHQSIPSGFEIHKNPVIQNGDVYISNLECKKMVNLDRGYASIGTLGGGNHFIEIDQDEDGVCYLVVHTGSRHLGLEVAKWYQDVAIHDLKQVSTMSIKDFVQKMKDEGRQKEIETELKKFKSQTVSDIPDALCYVEGSSFDSYIHDMIIMQHFAKINRRIITDIIMEKMGWRPISQFETIHNYIDTENMILRKGAVSAQKDEKLLIPINMRDGSLICIGKGNPDWNFSAPHGAGRLMSRAEARKSLSMSEYQKEMNGIYSTSVCPGTIDESPMAYKGMDDIINNIGPTADILKVIKPVYNFKAKE